MHKVYKTTVQHNHEQFADKIVALKLFRLKGDDYHKSKQGRRGDRTAVAVAGCRCGWLWLWLAVAVAGCGCGWLWLLCGCCAGQVRS